MRDALVVVLYATDAEILTILISSYSPHAVIRTIETRLVPYSARNIDLPVPNFGVAKKAEESTDEQGNDAATQETNGNAEKQDEKQEGAAGVVGRKRKLKGKSVGEHIVAKKDDEIRGHTAYLTFATKFFA